MVIKLASLPVFDFPFLHSYFDTTPPPPLQVHGPLVLQLQRMKDVSQPMAAQKDPLRIDTGGGGQRMLKLQLTDGKCHFSALEIDKLIELG